MIELDDGFLEFNQGNKVSLLVWVNVLISVIALFVLIAIDKFTANR